MTVTASISVTGDPYLDGIVSGIKWGVTSLTFSFPSSASYYEYAGESGNNFKAFTYSSAERGPRGFAKLCVSRQGHLYRDNRDVAPNMPTLRYAESDSPSTAWAYYPTTSAQGGDAWFGNSSHYYDNPINGNYAYLTMLHETGHALGLKHPQDVKGSFGTEAA